MRILHIKLPRITVGSPPLLKTPTRVLGLCQHQDTMYLCQIHVFNAQRPDPRGIKVSCYSLILPKFPRTVQKLSKFTSLARLLHAIRCIDTGPISKPITVRLEGYQTFAHWASFVLIRAFWSVGALSLQVSPILPILLRTKSKGPVFSHHPSSHFEFPPQNKVHNAR